MATNPYLADQAKAITEQSNQNLQNNVLPGINQGAQMAGGYGSSRQGIAQGQAIGMANQGLTNSLAGMYGQSYQADQANETSRANAATGAAASNYGADQSRMASMYGANLGFQSNVLNNQTSRYNSDQGNATQRYGTDASTGLGYSGLSNQYNIAGMNNATQQRGQDQSYGLGLGQIGATTRGQDINQSIATQSNQTQQRGQDQSYTLGQGNLTLGQQQAANQYDLGMRSNSLGRDSLSANTGLGYAGFANQLGIAGLNNQTQQRGQDQNYNLGLGQNANQGRSIDNQFSLGTQANTNQANANQNNFNLGMANNNLGFANLDSNNQQFGSNFGLNVMDAQNRWANNNVNTANQMAQTPINQFNGFNQNATQIAGQGSSQSQTNQGNPWLGALGGMQLGSQMKWGGN